MEISDENLLSIYVQGAVYICPNRYPQYHPHYCCNMTFSELMILKIVQKLFQGNVVSGVHQPLPLAVGVLSTFQNYHYFVYLKMVWLDEIQRSCHYSVYPLAFHSFPIAHHELVVSVRIVRNIPWV